MRQTKPFTKVDRRLSAMMPFVVGIALPFPLLVFIVEPNFFWAFQVVAIFLIPWCVRSRLRGTRRYREIDAAARARGAALETPGIVAFTEAELDEIALIKGPAMPNAIRALSAGVEHT